MRPLYSSYPLANKKPINNHTQSLYSFGGYRYDLGTLLAGHHPHQLLFGRSKLACPFIASQLAHIYICTGERFCWSDWPRPAVPDLGVSGKPLLCQAALTLTHPHQLPKDASGSKRTCSCRGMRASPPKARRSLLCANEYTFPSYRTGFQQSSLIL